MAINTEPSNLRIEVAQRGILWLEVKTKGRAAHGGRPWLGVNSINQMVDFLTRIKKLEKEFVKLASGNKLHQKIFDLVNAPPTMVSVLLQNASTSSSNIVMK